ncbi:HNH endonuclease signature motif containing protein [Microbacterium sp. 1.5R]|uniref:HNH endonuclease signature motif containing protein n=1 Tax=Microbacterium sp. 1.5R TaxID=1916917 RepID=UPI0011A28A97|nr:HNH endonuclease signature motif containing protein [Microbacterium sp. 1.5R]
MTHPAATLAQVASDLDAVLSGDALAGVSDVERLTVLQAAGAVLRRVEAVVVETLASTDTTELAHSAGCRTPRELLQRALLLDGPSAGRVVKAVGAVARESSPVSGEWLPARWPALLDALLDGVIGVAGIVSATAPVEGIRDRIGTEERLTADAFLADAARGLRDGTETRDEESRDDDGIDAGAIEAGSIGPGVMPEDLGRLAQQIALVLDPDGPEPDDQRALQRRGLEIGRLHQGLHRITGHLLPDAAAQLRLIVDAMLNPKVAGGPPHPSGVTFEASQMIDATAAQGDDIDPDPWNEDPRAVIDPRTHTQKRHDAFAAALGIAARHEEMPSLGGAAPTLVVTVDAKDLVVNAGRAHLPGSDATIPTSAAAHRACAGVIQRVVVDEGRIVGITVTDRVFTVHQRRAIVARDRECLIPGCHVPASWCEIHHVTEHARGGATATDNGVPLCWWQPPLPRHLRVGDTNAGRCASGSRSGVVGSHSPMAHTHPQCNGSSQATRVRTSPRTTATEQRHDSRRRSSPGDAARPDSARSESPRRNPARSETPRMKEIA